MHTPRTHSTRPGLGLRRLGPRLVLGLCLAAVTGLVTPRVASAQQLLEPPRARQGYYFAAGYHFLVAHAWEDRESWKPWLGSGLSVRFGQLVTRRFGLGLQINSGSARGQGQTATMGGLELEAQWEIARNLSIHGATGIDVISLSSNDGSDKTTRGTVGAGYSLALAYDWFFTHRLTGGWAATPTLQARFIPGSTAYALVGLLGIQISYWTGLPRNQLELPPGEAFQRQ